MLIERTYNQANSKNTMLEARFSIAPMMDGTNSAELSLWVYVVSRCQRAPCSAFWSTVPGIGGATEPGGSARPLAGFVVQRPFLNRLVVEIP
jgi:hypothetical protein